jgi:general secretion pathway protein A
MFATHWGLNRSPFTASSHPADYYPSSTQEEAQARLLYLVENGRRLGFLVGDTGIGKSEFFVAVARQLREKGCHVQRLNLTGLNDYELTWRLATGLGHLTTSTAGPVEWWRGVADRLVSLRYQKMTTVILLDDVGSGQGVDATISRLALTDPHPEARFTILLAGTFQEVELFDSKLHDLCELRIELEPWEHSETGTYVREALVRQGGGTGIFTDSALIRLHELSGGIPRRIRQLAEVALATGAAEGLSQIEPQVVELAYRGLVTDGMVDAA